MPLTHYPNGVSTDSDVVQVVAFSSSSAAETQYAYVPFDATIESISYIAGTASRVATYAVLIGSAGTTIVTSASNTTAVAGTVEALTLASATVASGDSLSVARGVQGTTGISQVAITMARR